MVMLSEKLVMLTVQLCDHDSMKKLDYNSYQLKVESSFYISNRSHMVLLYAKLLFGVPYILKRISALN